MEVLTKQDLIDKLTYRGLLKCDMPIWEEFSLGLEYHGGTAINTKFRGVRCMDCKDPQSGLMKKICIVSKNPKSKRFFDTLMEIWSTHCDVTNISTHERCGKTVYVVECKWKENES